MSAFTLENPVFVAFAIAAALTVYKVIGQGWISIFLMLKSGSGWASQEDLRPGLINRAPDPSQLDPRSDVERSRRMHRNDLENIPAFWMAGLLFVATEPPLILAQLLFYGFVAARLGHFWAYGTAKSHELRATFYTIASLIIAGMAAYVLWVTLAG